MQSGRGQQSKGARAGEGRLGQEPTGFHPGAGPAHPQQLSAGTCVRGTEGLPAAAGSRSSQERMRGAECPLFPQWVEVTQEHSVLSLLQM